MGVFRIDVDGNVNAAFKLRAMPKELGEAIQKDIQTTVAPTVIKNIKSGMPVSNRTNVPHMKTGDSLKIKMLSRHQGFRNYGIYVAPKGHYWYMKFPNNGTSTSASKGARPFFEIGMRKSQSIVNATIARAVAKQATKTNNEI